MDLQNADETVTGHFSDTLPTVKESEALTSCLEPVFKQMGTLGIASSHWQAVLFLLLMGLSCNGWKKLKIHLSSPHELINEVNNKVLFIRETKGYCMTAWMSVIFKKFWKVAECEKKASCMFLQFVVGYQKDFPEHTLA